MDKVLEKCIQNMEDTYDEKFYNRYVYYVDMNFDEFKQVKILGKKFLITK